MNRKKKSLSISFMKPKKYNIIETISLKNNAGLGKALREGLNYCKNNFIARFDSDDINITID